LLLREFSRIRSSSLACNAGWLFVGQSAGVVLQALYFIMLARFLGAAEYGVYTGAFAFSGLVAQYASLGSGTLLLRYVSKDNARFALFWGNVLLSTFACGFILILALHVLASWALNPASARLVFLAAISNCLLAPLAEQAARVFQCFDKMTITALLNLLTNLVRTLTVFAMLWNMHHATAWQWAAASTAVSGMASALAIAMVVHSFGMPRFSIRLFLKHGLEGLGYSFASSTVSVYNDFDKTMLSHFGMNAANGVYTMAYRVIDVVTIPIYSIREAALPRLFTHGYEGIAEAKRLAFRLLKRILPLAGLIASGIFLLSGLIPRLLGSGFAESTLALRWLCVIPVFRCFHILIGSVLTGAGLQGYRTVAQLTVAILNIGLNIWAIPRFGWIGAAWASLAADGTLCLLTWAVLQIATARTISCERELV
jgi:O-antigen/teichoic acid export membrane protein